MSEVTIGNLVCIAIIISYDTKQKIMRLGGGVGSGGGWGVERK